MGGLRVPWRVLSVQTDRVVEVRAVGERDQPLNRSDSGRGPSTVAHGSKERSKGVRDGMTLFPLHGGCLSPHRGPLKQADRVLSWHTGPGSSQRGMGERDAG